MSDLKLSPNLNLGYQELQYFKDSLGDNGYRKLFKKFTSSYGVVQTPSDTNFTSLKVVPGTTNKVTIKSGIAIDLNLKFIEVLTDLTDLFTVPSDSVPRYIIIKYAETVIETGTVSIAANGDVTGTGTLFTSRIRGGANFATKIKFPASSVNTGEYQVRTVQSDTVLSLNVSGSQLTVESGATFAIVGSYTPGIQINNDDKYPFIGDSYTIELRTSATLASGEYILAKVINTGSALTISERRPSNKFSIAPANNNIISDSNPIIGVEYMKYQNFRNPGDTNLITIGWGWTSSDFVINEDAQQCTFNSGFGGIQQGILPFLAAFSLAGWNLIFDNGQVVKVTASSVPAGNWVFDMEYASSYPTTGSVVIVPNADAVEIRVTNQLIPNANRVWSFPAAARYGIIDLQAGTISKVQYRNILGTDQTTEFANLNNGNYLNESSFDKYGNATSANYTAYMSGLLEPQISPSNFFDYYIGANMIMMYNGDVDNLPLYWYLCDGQDGRPDLREKFVLGYKKDGTIGNAIGNTGGSATTVITKESLPSLIPKGVVNAEPHSHVYKNDFHADVFTWSVPSGYYQDTVSGTIIGAGGTDTDNDKIAGRYGNTQDAAIVATFSGSEIGGTSEPLSVLNPYYVLAFIIRVPPSVPTINGTITAGIDVSALGSYISDQEAGDNGVIIGNPYKLANGNIYGGIPGIIKIKIS